MADRPAYPNYLGDTFARDVAEHQLTILHDDGLYRHLRCARPGSGAAIAAQPGSDHSQPPSSRIMRALHGIPDTAQPWQRRTTTALAEAGITVDDLRAMAIAACAR